MMRLKNLLISSLLLLSVWPVAAQELVEPALVQWYTLDQALEKYEQEKRPLFIDVYTDWCGWCKRMMKTTFANREVATYINRHFYAVRLDAESKDTLYYLDSAYVNRNKTHDLAMKMLNGRPSYPTIVYRDRKGNLNPVPGYMKPTEILPLLIFFGEDIYQNSSFEDFEREFKLTYLADQQESSDSLTAGKVNWLSYEEAIAKNKEKARPIFLDIYGQMYIRCNIMENATYKHPVIADILNQYFYPVHFNAASQDTVRAFANTFTNPGQGHYSLHSFAGYFMGQNLQFPSIFIMNDKQEVINRMNGYFPATELEPILMFFAQKQHLKADANWETYRREFKSKINP